jgi:NAD(P)-dependent dehydrogenase (short-subunit alcohol dehydrogenase family)
MEIPGSHIIITGAANGIGAAMARRFARDGAKVIVADLDGNGAAAVAAQIKAEGGTAIAAKADVSREADVKALVDLAEASWGGLDLFCSNAGVMVQGGPDASDSDWSMAWNVNVMAHVYAARAALPAMLERGSGYLLNTCSSAGLLTALGAAPYAVSKHAAVAFSEWLAITYADRGIGVSALCPSAVRTRMVEDAMAGDAGNAVKAAGRMLEPDDIADQVTCALAANRFLILTHDETQEYVTKKVADPERWIRGMSRLAAAL